MKHSIFDNTDADNGKQIETKNARNGGYLVGRSHKEGGIKGVNVDTGEPIEVEGGEVVITKPAVESKKTYTLNGKKMKPKEILSKLNSDHGGVAFAQGGQVGGKKFLLGGINDVLTEKFLQKRFNPNIAIRTSGDDLDSEIRKAEAVFMDSNEDIVVRNSFRAGESSTERFINCVTFGDIFYMKRLNPAAGIRKYLEPLNPTVDFSISEIPFILKDILSKDGKQIDTLILERTYTNSDGNVREETLTWDREIWSYYQDDVVAVPKINQQELVDFFAAEGVNYDVVKSNSQDFLNGKYLVESDGNGLHIGGYGQGIDSNGNIIFITKDYYGGFVNDQIRSTQKSTDAMVAVGDVWEIKFRRYYAVKRVELQQEGLDFQLLKQDGVYVINYEYQEQAEASALLFTNSDPEINLFQVFFIEGNYDFGGKTGSLTDPKEELTVKIIGLILTKNSGQVINYNCQYFLVEDINTGEKSIISQPEFVKCVSLATADDYGQTVATISEEEKKVRMAKKKDVRDAQLYEILLEGLSQEEARLIVMKGLISSSDKLKNLNIDRRLNEIATLKAQYKLDSQTALNLLDQFETMFYVEKSSRENKSGDVSINGQPSELTPSQYERVRSPEFIDWFGDWMTAYELDDYTGVSKIMNPRTAEPMVLFHGTDVDFTAWKFNQFPAAYFGDNRSYSEWFANLKSQGGEGHMYECFINIKNPIDLRQYGLENHKMGDILNYLEEKYDLNPRDIVPELNRLNPEQFDQVMEVNMKAWQFVRRGVPFLNYVKENTFYDGILMFEDNPQDIITTTVDGEQVQVPNTTGSFVVFREGQIKWAGATYFNSIISDNRFAKGGKIKSLAKKYKEMDFVF
jgi:hypothetical protein